MNLQITKNHNSQGSAFAICTMVFASIVLLTVTQDFIRSSINNSSFYFLEAFMFSSFWWIFIPFLFGQYLSAQIKNSNTLTFNALLISIPVILHLYAFPFLVWVISKLLYYHTYDIDQTFQYTLSEHLYQVLFVYSIPIFIYRQINAKDKKSVTVAGADNQTSKPDFVTSIMISDGDTRKTIAVTEILYFKSNSPYVDIYVNSRRYLKSETLKSLTQKLNIKIFIRVHKSTIVNIEQVQSYTSRLNGDYDVTMSDGAKLRVSRNFASDFKKKFQESHRITTE